MKVAEIVREDLIFLDLKGTNIREILRELAESIWNVERIADPTSIYEALLERENQDSTGVAPGAAIPHCKLPNIHELLLAIGYSQAGIDFNAHDENLTHFFFVVLANPNESGRYLGILSSIAKLFKSPDFLFKLKNRPSKSELIKLIREEEGTLVK